MQNREYNIAAVTSQLKTKFSQLALIPDELLPTSADSFYYLFARRNGILTLSLYVLSQNVAQVLGCLGQTVPSTMQELLDNSQAIILDLDSVTAQGPWRFYIKTGEYDADWVSTSFVQTETPADLDNKRLEGIGFYFDPQADQVTQYKYYWFDLETRIEVRQRFNTSGELLNTQEVTVSGLAGTAQINSFGINDINFTDFMLNYQYQTELDQQYITVTKDNRNIYTEYSSQSYGAPTVVAEQIPDQTDYNFNPLNQT